MSEETIQDLLRITVRRSGKRAAVLFGEERITYEELDRESNRLANGLKSLGVKETTRVAMMLPNIPEFVCAFLAIQKIGAVAVPINTLYKTAEILHVLRDSGSHVIITLSNYVPAIQEILHETELRHIVSVGERDLTFAHPGCRFLHLILRKDAFGDVDEVYHTMGQILLDIAKRLHVRTAWYKHRGSLRADSKRLGGAVVQETEHDYVITLHLFTGPIDVDDFLEVIWVPPEIRDRIVEPMTSVEEETGTAVTHEVFREVALSVLNTTLGAELIDGNLTRDESFAYQRTKSLSSK
ncbi:MAG: hypothetical protein AMJ46_13490 [Latescibacteria bacterium DG_63]|nr:MAG: hypothetical protein AMJ46_13490 [Latescibacteria bacterium DG_63]